MDSIIIIIIIIVVVVVVVVVMFIQYIYSCGCNTWSVTLRKGRRLGLRKVLVNHQNLMAESNRKLEKTA